MKSDLIVYQLSRVKVEKGDFNHFLDLYDPHKLPTGQPLKATMGRMLFCIEGYDADQMILVQVEVRLLPGLAVAEPVIDADTAVRPGHGLPVAGAGAGNRGQNV